jgi:hypothetical protein
MKTKSNNLSWMARFAKWQIRYSPTNTLFLQRLTVFLFLFASAVFIIFGIISRNGFQFVTAAVWLVAAFSRMLIAGFQELIEKEYKK